MSKSKSPKLTINLDLLRPQSNPDKIHVKFIRWLLSTGRFIFIFVEAIVLLAFIARFKLDADLASNREAIEEKIPYIESLKPFEILIRQTQFKLATIDSFNKTYADYGQILKKVADLTPQGIKIISINIEKNISKLSINLNAQAQTNSDLTIFLDGLKKDPLFTEVNITSVGFEKGNLNFSLSTQAMLTQGGRI